jgi:DNA-binding response OmpR family regulator
MEKRVPKILVIENDVDLLELYYDVFHINGVDVLFADSGQKALELFKLNQDIQVIISDANIGSISGMSVLLNLRTYYKTVPVFYLMTGSLEYSEIDIISAGGKGLFLKPFDPNQIIERIKKDIKF